MSAVRERTALSAGQAAILGELRALLDRLPLPQPSWHPHVPEILACRDDFAASIGAAAERPEALDAFAELLDEESAELEPDAPAELQEAWARLHALPIPEGQHPFLDEILPALEAMRLLLVALSRIHAEEVTR